MGLFDRLRMGLVLTRDSLGVLRHNPRLTLFPIVSGVAGLGFLALFLGVTFGLTRLAAEGGAVVGLFLAYVGLTFISSLFAAGLVHQTREVFAGREPSMKAGLRAAWERKWPLFVWSVIAGTIGILINALETSDSRIGQIVGVLFGVAWTLLTFFIIPVIVFERTSIVDLFRESAATFKATYGETPVSMIGVQVVALVVALPFALPGIVLIQTSLVVVGVALIATGVILAFIVSQTLQGVVKTTLYVYAEEGTKPAEFDDVDFNSLGG